MSFDPEFYSGHNEYNIAIFLWESQKHSIDQFTDQQMNNP